MSTSVNEMKYSISTNILYLINAFSEKKFDKFFVVDEYHPSIGEIAFKDFLDIN